MRFVIQRHCSCRPLFQVCIAMVGTKKQKKVKEEKKVKKEKKVNEENTRKLGNETNQKKIKKEEEKFF